MADVLNFLAPTRESRRLPFVLQADLPEARYAAVQTWVLAFLTDKGSRPLDTEYGTEFVKTLNAGRLYTEADVRRVFDEASLDALSYCRLSEIVPQVVDAVLTDVRVDATDGSKFVVLYTAFVFSDGTQTRTFIEV